MKIRQLIESKDIEPHYSTNTLINIIKEKCSQFINEFGEYPPIMRIDNSGINGFDIRQTKEVREAKSFLFRNIIFNKAYNKLLREYGHNDRIHYVVFGSTVKETKGVLMGKAYYMIPTDNYSYTYNDITGPDFNVDNPMFKTFSEVINILSDNFEEYFEVLTNERDELMKELDDKKIKIQLHDMYSYLLEVSEKIDKDPFDESIEEDYKKLVEQYSNIKNLFDDQIINMKNIIHDDLKMLVENTKTIKKFIKNHYHTDEISESLFSSPTEIHFKTKDYVLIDPEIIDYKELINKAK